MIFIHKTGTISSSESGTHTHYYAHQPHAQRAIYTLIREQSAMPDTFSSLWLGGGGKLICFSPIQNTGKGIMLLSFSQHSISQQPRVCPLCLNKCFQEPVLLALLSLLLVTSSKLRKQIVAHTGKNQSYFDAPLARIKQYFSTERRTRSQETWVLVPALPTV